MSRKEIGIRLRMLRKLRGFTQAQMGLLAMLRKESVSHIEHGDREVSYYEMVCFAQNLCFSLDAFHRTGADGQWDITACLLPYTASLVVG
jgi:transcriptional regulator with XRE-family HTH domain